MGVGRRLRQARETKGLSMADVSARTKIPLRQLAALEAEEYDMLPGGIFVRGHIRASAKAVGLDPSELTEHFEEETRPIVPVPLDIHEGADSGPRLRMAVEPRESKPNGQLIAALVILLSIVLAIAWFGRGRDLPPSSQNDAAPRADLAAVGTVPRTEPGAIGTIGTVRRESLPEADGMALSLKAQRVCWVALTVDGQRVAYRMLREGDTVTARVYQRATLRTGDAGALLLSLAGSLPTPLGAAGAVRTMELTPADAARLARR
jgi:cytoskeleton protein RodZ